MGFVYFLLVLFGIFIIVIGIWSTMAQIKTWHLLKDIADSGAIPKLFEYQTKKEAKELIQIGVSNERLDIILSSLEGLSNDQEAEKLAQKLREIKGENATGTPISK